MPPRRQQKPKPRKPPSPSSTNTASPSRVPTRRRFQLRMPLRLPQPSPRTARVLEVGCGTGCISLSIAFGSVAATSPALLPISSRAIDLATKTAMRLALRPTRSPSASTNLVSSISREEGHL